jgi:hypothetical protein
MVVESSVEMIAIETKKAGYEPAFFSFYLFWLSHLSQQLFK